VACVAKLTEAALAQAQDRLHPDLDSRLMVASLVGLTLFPAAGAPSCARQGVRGSA